MEKEILNKLQQEELLILKKVDYVCKKNNINYFLVGGTLLGTVRHKGFIPWDDDLDIGMLRKDFNKFLNVCQDELGDQFLLDWFSTNKNYWLPFAKIRLKNTIYQEYYMQNNCELMGIWLDIFPIDNASKKHNNWQKFQFFFTMILKFALAEKQGITMINNKFKRILLKTFCLLPKRFILWLQLKIMTFNKNDNSKYLINLGSQYGYKKQTHLREKYFPVKELEFNGKKYPVPNDYDYVLTKIYGPNYMELPPLEKRITHNPIRIKLLGEDEIKYEKEI